ncbi:aminopeptidase, partial [Campylobacter lari]|nr:aminopeptidase [Campylobacter lari]
HSIASGSKVFDWEVPAEWEINNAYIITPNGEKICDFKQNNLHVLNYSTGIDTELNLASLQKHLYSIEEMPDAIPYVTSYYKRRWGFCIKHEDRVKLKEGKYKVFIDAKHHENGVLNYADLLIPSTQETKDEILISTYLCHPSMANNELSGPVVAVFLVKWLLELKERKYNYRFVFTPETIGSIVYLSKHLKHLQKHTKAGFVLSCIGDDNAYSLIHTPSENTLADKVALHTLKDKNNFKEFSFLYRGSNERQFCSPLVNLPVVCICRTRFGDYKEYHTSKDDLSFISQTSLENSLQTLKEIIANLEVNEIYQNTVFCEPNLGKRDLYHTINKKAKKPISANFLAYCDGKNDVLDIASKLNIQAYELKDLIEKLKFHGLIK